MSVPASAASWPAVARKGRASAANSVTRRNNLGSRSDTTLAAAPAVCTASARTSAGSISRRRASGAIADDKFAAAPGAANASTCARKAASEICNGWSNQRKSKTGSSVRQGDTPVAPVGMITVSRLRRGSIFSASAGSIPFRIAIKRSSRLAQVMVSTSMGMLSSRDQKFRWVNTEKASPPVAELTIRPSFRSWVSTSGTRPVQRPSMRTNTKRRANSPAAESICASLSASDNWFKGVLSRAFAWAGVRRPMPKGSCATIDGPLSAATKTGSAAACGSASTLTTCLAVSFAMKRANTVRTCCARASVSDSAAASASRISLRSAFNSLVI